MFSTCGWNHLWGFVKPFEVLCCVCVIIIGDNKHDLNFICIELQNNCKFVHLEIKTYHGKPLNIAPDPITDHVGSGEITR